MKHCQQLNWILLVLLTTVTGTEAIITDSLFNMLQEGQLITGEIFADFSAKSSTHCSIMCLSTEECKAYMYKGTGQENCFLIKRNSTATDGQLIEMNNINIIYQKNFCDSDQCQNGGECVTTDNGYKCECVDGYLGNHCEDKDNCFPSNDCINGTKCIDGESICSQDSGGIWTKPSNWTGPDAVLYRSFDNMDGLVFMEGTEQRNYAPLVAGQVNCAWTLSQSKRQWVDLGIRTEACMTQPESCGAAGGAISFRLKVIDCPSPAGILSSQAYKRTGFRIYCSGNLLFYIFLRDRYFTVSYPKPTGWAHAVLNYLGPDDGIRIFIDGQEVANDTTKHVVSRSAGDSRIVVGRRYTNKDRDYASVQLDELIFFSQTLSLADIIALNNSVSVL